MPEWKDEIRRRMAALEIAPPRAEEIADELGQHLEDRYAELLAGGVTEAQARRDVLAELESGASLPERLAGVERPAPVRVELGTPAREGLWRGLGDDLRYAVRALARSRGVTLIALSTLALGIGANAVVFSLVDATLLRPLPFPEPHRIVRVWGTAPDMGILELNYPDAVFAYFRSRTQTLESLVAYNANTFTLTGGGEPERMNGASVTGDFFRLLGQSPMEGRGFLPEEERRGADPVVVVGHGLWQRRFAGDPAIVGRPLVLDGKPATVVGVMPPGFDFPAPAGATELWTPLQLDPQSFDCWCYSLAGRLAPGRAPDDAARELSRLADDFWRDRDGRPRLDPDSKEPTRSIVFAVPMAHKLAGEVRTPLLVLLGAVAMVLLIACANVANLLLARATARTREVAVRACLGASPWRIARQLLLESLLLALGGAALGLAFAFGIVRVVGPVIRDRMAQAPAASLDLRVVAFTLVLTLLTGLTFGLVPALRGARLGLHEAVKDGARAGQGVRGRRLNHAFVVSQFALSLMLLVGAGLLLRSFRNLLEVDLGFRPRNVLVGRTTLPPSFAEQPEKIAAFYDRLVERVGTLPGVQALGLASNAPFGQGDNAQLFRVRGQEPAPGKLDLVARFRVATPGYFDAAGIATLRGRPFAATDTATSLPVAMVDESLARLFFPDGDAVGHEVRVGGATSRKPWRTIVGVVPNVKHGDPGEDATRYVYVPFAQNPYLGMDVVMRTAGEPGALAAAVRREVLGLEAEVPFYEVHTLDAAVGRVLATRRLTNRLLVGFGLAALLLASIGVYGVMAVNVSQRMTEFGVRLALGATPSGLVRLVLGEGLRLAALGLALGLAGAAGLTRVVASLLFRVPPGDAWTFGSVTLALIVAAVAACYLPARRATRADPQRVLRSE